MSIRAAFGIGATLGFVTAALLGAPLAPAIVYGLLTGGVFAAIAATPPGQRGIAVVHHRRPAFFGTWSLGGPWFRSGPRVAHGVHVLPHGPVPVRPSAVPSTGRSWIPSMPSFPSFSGSSRTTVHQTPGARPTGTTTVSTPMGGTSHHTTAAVPGHARNVKVTSTRFK